MITFTPVGDWTGVVIGLRALPGLVKSGGVWGQRKAAEKLVKIVKGHIDNQDLGWIPSMGGGDPRTLVDTELYRNSIKAWKSGDSYYAGVPTNLYYPNGNQVSTVAAEHEFGLGKNIERPLWRPSVDELGGAEGVKKIIGKAIFNRIAILASRGITVKKPYWL